MKKKNEENNGRAAPNRAPTVRLSAKADAAFISHEEVHRGDWLDGSRQESTDPSGFGSEPGTYFMEDVFESVDKTVDGQTFRPATGMSIHGSSKDLIEAQKQAGNGSIVPTVPPKPATTPTTQPNPTPQNK